MGKLLEPINTKEENHKWDAFEEFMAKNGREFEILHDGIPEDGRIDFGTADRWLLDNETEFKDGQASSFWVRWYRITPKRTGKKQKQRMKCIW